MANLPNKYSSLDKFLQYLAFNSISTQKTISNLENKIFKNKLQGIEINKPVFITALPRAGTTLMLEILTSSTEFVSNTYRDMPFFLIPILWNKYAGYFKQSDEQQERAHGDGMMVSVDSPEAFDEIIWKSFWQSRYRKDRIIPWGNVNYPEFESFFYNHIRKTKYLKINNSDLSCRYISKNNLNIARIEYLNNIFPDSIILVLFREPLQHASSLLRQHLNFLEIHDNDHFACKYMEEIGHYDFGRNLKPVDFDNWLTPALLKNTTTLSFWLQYWINTYRYLLNRATVNTKFISFESLCDAPEANLKKLGELLESKNPQKLIRNANRVTKPNLHGVNTNSIDKRHLEEAQKLYANLNEASIV